MNPKNLVLMVIAMIMTLATLEVKSEVCFNTKAEVQHYNHPKKGKIAKWKANRIKRHAIKRQMKRRLVRPRHRGITIVI